MALYNFTTRNSVKLTIGYQKCDNCGFMKPCLYLTTPLEVKEPEVYICLDCHTAAVASFDRLNKADVKPKIERLNSETSKRVEKGHY